MRVDGKIKLKYKAVPTLFNNLIQDPSHASTSESVEKALHPSTLKEIDVLSNQENDANNEADEEINNSESSDEYEEDELSLKNVRKVRKWIQHLKFNTGILDEAFDFLKMKVSSFENSSDKHCAIVFDETSIAPGRVFDPSTNTYLGNATIPDSKSQFFPATHSYAVMLALEVDENKLQHTITLGILQMVRY
ncbi:hypothetical protein PV325_011389 [Microctonus aethiopoides]|nr:hypothetical protein PV325_011389 [Microctonus aethiopoides]